MKTLWEKQFLKLSLLVLTKRLKLKKLYGVMKKAKGKDEEKLTKQKESNLWVYSMRIK